MTNRITQAAAGLKHFRVAAYVAGLGTKAPFDRAMTMRLLAEVQRRIPGLSESAYDEKTDTFQLLSSAQEQDKQVAFRVERASRVQLVWGPESGFGSAESLGGFFDGLQEGFDPGRILLVNYVDLHVYAISSWAGNHYKAIWESFYAASPIYRVAEPDSLVDDDLEIRLSFGEDGTCVVRVSSDISRERLRRQSFGGVRLTASAALARTRGIALDARLTSVFGAHSTESVDFIVNKFLPHVLFPLDATVEKMSSMAIAR